MRTLEQLCEDIKSCTLCGLCKTRTNTVFARGNPDAKIICIAEAPGQSENSQGVPLVGASGQLLNTALKELNIDISTDIYVCNIIKCWPPNNRKPTEDEINICIDYLDEQLGLLPNMKVIIALGNTAIQSLTNTPLGVTKLRGTFLKYKQTPVLCAFHPSAILRAGGIGSKMYETFKQDIQLAINKSTEPNQPKKEQNT